MAPCKSSRLHTLLRCLVLHALLLSRVATRVAIARRRHGAILHLHVHLAERTARAEVRDQAVLAAVALDAELVAHLLTLEQQRDPRQVAVGRPVEDTAVGVDEPVEVISVALGKFLLALADDAVHVAGAEVGTRLNDQSV